MVCGEIIMVEENEKQLHAKNLRKKNLMLLAVIIGFCSILFFSVILRQQGF